jgi:hypothetical protein
LVDCSYQVWNAGKYATPDSLLGDLAEPPLDHVLDPHCCQEKLQEALERRLELSKMALNVKQAARICRRSEGHIRRVLGHPEKYHWSDYGIIDAYRLGKEWEIIVEPLEHKEVLAKQLMDVGQGALNYMRLNSIFGLGPVLTPCDIRCLLECQIKPLPALWPPAYRRAHSAPFCPYP